MHVYIYTHTYVYTHKHENTFTLIHLANGRQRRMKHIVVSTGVVSSVHQRDKALFLFSRRAPRVFFQNIPIRSELSVKL